MAAATRATASQFLTTAGSSVSVAEPASVVSGDLLLAFVIVAGGGTVTPPVPAPGNLPWTQVYQSHAVGATTRLVVFRKIADPNETPNHVFTLGASGLHAIGLIALAGADWSAGDPLDGTPQGVITNGVNLDFASSAIPVEADRRVVAFGYAEKNSSYTPPAQLTERLDVTNGLVGASGRSMWAGDAHNHFVAAFAPGSPAASDGTSVARRMVTVLVKSAPQQEPSPIYRRALTPTALRGSDNKMWVQRPAALRVGDVMLALVLGGNASGLGAAYGWTALGKAETNGTDTTLLYRVATAWDLAQAQWGFYVPDVERGKGARVAAYAGVRPNTPLQYGGFAAYNSAATGNAPSIVTTETGEMYVAVASAGTAQDFTWPASMSGSSAGAETLEFVDEPRPVAGATGVRTVSPSASTYLAVGSVALYPQRVVPLTAVLAGEGSLSGRMNRGVTNMPMRASLAAKGSLTGNMAPSPPAALPSPIGEVLVPRKTTPRREADLLITEEAPPPVGRSWAFEYWGEREGFVREGGRGALETREIATLRQWIEKCVAHDQQVLMADGTRKAISDVCPGDLVLSSNGEGISYDEVTACWATGHKRVMRIGLSDGRELRVTPEHRIFGWDDWTEAGDLRLGDPVCVPERVPEFLPSDVREDDAFLIALWLAEGSKSEGGFGFYNDLPEVLDRVGRIARVRGWTFAHDEKNRTCRLGGCHRRVGDTPSALLRRFGVRGMTTHAVAVPAEIMRAADHIVAEFLGTYIACDGCVERKAVTVCSVSERMVRDLQLLCARFGVRGRVVRSRDPKPGHQQAWTLRISSRLDVERLVAAVRVPGKQEKLEATAARMTSVEATSDRLLPPALHDDLAVAGPRRGPTLRPGYWADRRRGLQVASAPENATDALPSKLVGGLGWARVVVLLHEEVATETFDMETRWHHAFFLEGGLTHNCLHTERGVHPIHPPDYGLRGLNEVIGAPPSSLALGTLAERVRQALIFHPRISDIENFRYSFDPADDLLEVSFRVLLDGDESVDVEQLTLS